MKARIDEIKPTGTENLFNVHLTAKMTTEMIQYMMARVEIDTVKVEIK